VASFPAPVITGIGHDKDAPLISMVSDKNVSTPTAVANLLSAGFREATLKLQISEQNLFTSFVSVLQDKLYFLEQSERVMEGKIRNIFERCQRYFSAIYRASDKIQSAIIQKKSDIENFAKILEARNPERQLRLGWSIARGSNGKIIRKVDDVKVGEDFEVRVADGNIQSIRK
jgi:exodeoxyribonuclease VII large subunit